MTENSFGFCDNAGTNQELNSMGNVAAVDIKQPKIPLSNSCFEIGFYSFVILSLYCRVVVI